MFIPVGILTVKIVITDKIKKLTGLFIKKTWHYTFLQSYEKSVQQSLKLSSLLF